MTSAERPAQQPCPQPAHESDQKAGQLPYVVASVTCDGCSSGYVASRLPGGPIPPTAHEAECAGRAGWRQDAYYATGWRCPRCRQQYGDGGSPRRFTVREVLARHRDRSAG